MDATVSNRWSSKQTTVSSYVSEALDGADFDRGEIETIGRTTSNIQDAFANLIEVLAKKGLLNGDEITHIVGTEFKENLILGEE